MDSRVPAVADDIKLEDYSMSLFSDLPTQSPGDWSLYSSPVHSSTAISLPHVRLARSVRGVGREGPKPKEQNDAAAGSLPSLYPISQSRPPSPSTPACKPRRIPRPPNAFILFRSDLLKNPNIIKQAPRHQQTLSRVAGECWNLLPAEGKRYWKDQAEERLAIHQREYPDYHFKPSPRVKGKVKSRSAPDNIDELVRSLRETCFGIRGPSICLSRQRKPKLQAEDVKPALGTSHSTFPSASPSVSSSGETQDPAAFSWAFSDPTPMQPKTEDREVSQSVPTAPLSFSPYDTQGPGEFNNWNISSSPSPFLSASEPDSTEPPLPPCFPQRTVLHFAAPRRPSTSLGFVRRLEDTSCFEPGSGIERPASAAGLSNRVCDLSITPTATNFASASMPSTPLVSGLPCSTWEENMFFDAPSFPLSDSQFVTEIDNSYDLMNEVLKFNNSYDLMNEAFNDWSLDISGSLGAGEQ
ncbi:hypothetical protein GGX14DRAFT_614642 [Mycena pura]|uniref:HMG box domain-containing protein n=1 Tax=Mycena pura TaxID=153505 RepID=A0AAD6YT13_9AGAR|nr:hypothetical protein GGX14DRAFT_614642 [Mycena pura]